MMNSVFKMICSVSRWDSVGGLGRGDNYGPTEWIGGKFVGQYGELSPGKLPICPYGSENHEFCSENHELSRFNMMNSVFNRYGTCTSIPSVDNIDDWAHAGGNEAAGGRWNNRYSALSFECAIQGERFERFPTHFQPFFD